MSALHAIVSLCASCHCVCIIAGISFELKFLSEHARVIPCVLARPDEHEVLLIQMYSGLVPTL